MKRIVLFATLALLSQPAFSAFVLNPLPGVTIKDLPQDVVDAIPAKAMDFFDSKLRAAEKDYNDAVANLKSNKKNKSGDNLNKQILEAVQKREKAFVDAKQETVCFAVNECKNLCTVELDGVTSAECAKQ